MHLVRYAIFISVAVVTFLVGVFVHRAFEPGEIAPVGQLQEDNLHKLFEAAGMLGTDDLHTEVLHRLMCVEADNDLNKRLVRMESQLYCMDAAGELTLLTVKKDSPFDRLSKEHVQWSSRNFEFIKSVARKSSAREYVITHLPK